MARFFGKFPRIAYSLSNERYPDYQAVTDILFRTAVIKDILTTTASYMEYIIRDGDTPENIASNVYDDPEGHWLILYANEMIDAQYDWPLTDVVFEKYIVDKYRAMAEEDEGRSLQDYEVTAWTQNLTNPASIHHYEMVVKQENQKAQVTTENRFIINKSRLTNNQLAVPFDCYDDLADVQDVTPINLTINGETVIQTKYRNAVTYYDYEFAENEEKRTIKIIKSEYYPQIVRELNALTDTEAAFVRRVS